MSNVKYVLMCALGAAAGFLLFRWVRRRSVCRSARGPQNAPVQGALIDDVLPMYEFGDRVGVELQARPAQIFEALKEVTLAEMPLAKTLGELRYLPARLTGRMRVSADDVPFMNLVLGKGTIVLAEEPQREIVTGTIGKFHNLLDQQVVPIRDADEFYRFDDPVYQKLVMSIRVREADTAGVYRLELEHRTHALSPSARRRFAGYWLIIRPGGAFVTKLLLHAVRRRAEAAGLQAGGGNAHTAVPTSCAAA